MYVFAILLGSSSVRRATGGIKYRNQGGVPEVGSNIEIKLRRDQVVHLSPSPPTNAGGRGAQTPCKQVVVGLAGGGGVSEICKNVCADTRTTTEACPPPELNARRDTRAGKPLTSIRGIAEYNCNV